MTPTDRIVAIDKLLEELTRKIYEYHDCLNSDAIFIVRKKIRVRLKEIEKEIADLKAKTPYLTTKIKETNAIN
jgi:hypothetical protein